jgi:hypothetical protein
MIRMLIVGYVFAIRSERLLCREVKVNLAYRWFCGLSIEDKIPDHSVFSRARNERFRESAIFRRVFERVVEASFGQKIEAVERIVPVRRNLVGRFAAIGMMQQRIRIVRITLAKTGAA